MKDLHYSLALPRAAQVDVQPTKLSIAYSVPTSSGSTRPSKKSSAAPKNGVREAAASATKGRILKAATKVFAKHGYDGGSIEKIAKAAGVFDRMIYYYYGSKEGLFIAVLEGVYKQMDEAESELQLDLEQPVEALLTVVRFVRNHYRKHPEFVRLLNTENLHKGKHISKFPESQRLSSTAVSVVDALLMSGVQQGLFRADLRARDVYVMIAAMGFFYESNRYTLSAFLGEALDRPETSADWERFMMEAVFRMVSVPPADFAAMARSSPVLLAR